MSPCVVTTSWDDGAPADVRLAALLARHGLPGTFYVPRANPERPVLAEGDLRDISRSFEIGSHTLGHRDLTALSADRARAELTGSRAWLEDVVGRPVTSFCFPQGRWHAAALRWVGEAGYTVARTADWFCEEPAVGTPALARPTVHAYPQPFGVHLAHCLRRGPVSGLWRYLPLARGSWEALACGAFDRVLARGGVFHLWGHSWEVDAQGLWGPLERVLAHVAGRPGVSYVTNAGLA